MSMINIFFSIVLVLSLSGCEHDISQVQKPANLAADAVLLDGNIYTVDESNPWAEAVAIRGSRYVYIGSSEGARRYIGSNTSVIDLEGAMAMPGLNQVHVHPMQGEVQDLYHCHFSFQATLDDIAKILRGCIAGRPGAKWIIGGQWGSGFFLANHMASPRKWLDEVSGDVAVALLDDSYHNRWFNSKALELAGITRNTPNPEGGSFGRDADGELNGLLYETASREGAKAIPDWTPEQYVRAAREVLRKAASYGITGLKDAAANESQLKALYVVDTTEGLNVHYAAAIRTPDENRAKPLDTTEIVRIRDTYAAPHLHTNFAKIFLDGVPTPARTAAMLEPYLPDKVHGEHYTGILHVAPEALAQDLINLDALGFTVKMHAAGDRSVRVGLDAIEAARKVNGYSGLRHELAHAGFIDPDDLPRFAKLGAVADISPVLWYPSPIIDAIISAVGKPRGEHYFPVRDLLDSGALVAAGTDWPAVALNMNPWGGIESLVTRSRPFGKAAGQYWPEQAITLEEALKINTINGARTLRLDDLTGSVELGKSADLIVLDRNLFEVPIDEVAETGVKMTFFEGHLVFAKVQ